MSLFRAFGVVIALMFAARGLADEAVWIGPATGDWKTAANWSTGVVPSSNSAARIDDNPSQNSRVESRVTFTAVGNLSIDPGDTFAVINSQFSVASPLILDGTVSIEGANANFTATTVVNPSGEIRLSNATATATSPSLFNEGTIHGGGTLALWNSNFQASTSWNESTIRADNATIPLVIQTPPQAYFENDGILAASSGGKLQILRANSQYDYGVHGGRIEAYPGSTVQFGSPSLTSPAYVEDSVLAVMDDNDPNTATPSFQFYSGSEFKNVKLEGKFAMGGATVIGSLTNPTELSPSSQTISSGGATYHNGLEGDVLLKGGGTINLGPGTAVDQYAMFGAPSSQNFPYRLTNVDNLIHGGGELAVSWYAFTNRSVVQADYPNKELIFYNGLSTGGLVNSGVMKATNGGHLRLGYSQGATSQMKNFEGGDTGEIVAGQNSVVILNLIQIQGGVLRTEGTDPATRGKFVAEAGVVLQDLTLDGTFRFLTGSGALSTVTLLNTVQNKGSLASRLLVGTSTSAELAGGGDIATEAGAFLTLNGSASLTNDDNVIHGVGTMPTGSNTNSITNRGTFRAEGGTLQFLNQMQFLNSGLLEAATGGTLVLPGSSAILNSEAGVGGTIHAAAGGIVTTYGIDGGTVATDGDGVVKVTNLIKDLHNTGTIQTAGAAIPRGVIVNDGLIKGTMSLTGQFVRFEGNGRWDGAYGSFGSTTVQNGPHHTILGVGDIGNTAAPYDVFQNEGTLQTSDTAVQSFRVFAGSFENSGLVHAPAGKGLTINSLFSRASNSGTLQADGNISVTSPNGLYNESGGAIDVRATLALGQTVLHNRSGATIMGNGQITGSIISGPLVVNEGVVDPGPGVGTLTIGDDFQQLGTGQLKIDVSGGATPLGDLLQINGAAALAGSLLVNHLGNEALVAGNSFTFLAATGGVSGVFGQLSLPTLDSNLFWYLDYEPTSVRAIVADVIPGDFNRNGSVGTEDYVWWRHNGGTPEQYDDWVANFGRTIDLGGGPMTAAQVPEPACGMLIVVCSVIASAMRHRKPSRCT